ncbi:DUF4209 domain-containing protein [Bacillus cereus]|nr:DUF4209 domain-containing protein [Bacillus cereus]
MNKINNMIDLLEKPMSTESFTDIYIKLRNFTSEIDTEEYNYELLAFSFHEGEQSAGKSDRYYETSYAYLIDEKYRNFLNESQLSKAILSYWGKRAKETTNNIIKSRYSDLVWELSKFAKWDVPNKIDYALIAIDSYIDIIERKLIKDNFLLIKASKRAFNLAQSIKNPDKIQKAKAVIMRLEKDIAVDNLPGLWGFSFDCLIEGKRNYLNEDEENIIIKNLENRVERLFSLKEDESHAIEHGVVRLASYYKKRKQEDKVRGLLKKLEWLFRKHEKVNTIHQTEYKLQKLLQLYRQHKMKEEEKRVLVKIADLGKQIKESLATFEYKTEINREEIERLFDALIGQNLDETLYRICLYFIPKRAEAEKQVKERRGEHLLSDFFSTTILAEDGRKIASIGSINDDFEGNVIKQISDELQIRLFFLDLIINEITNRHKFSADKLFEVLAESPAFDKNKHEILKQGIDLYFKENHIASINILVPQIEESLRNIIRLCEGNIIKPTDSGGFDVILLTDILNSEILMDVYNSDILLYFKIILNDKRGFNLRNNLMHGLAGKNTFNIGIANLIIHLLLIISLFKEEV